MTTGHGGGRSAGSPGPSHWGAPVPSRCSRAGPTGRALGMAGSALGCCPARAADGRPALLRHPLQAGLRAALSACLRNCPATVRSAIGRAVRPCFHPVECGAGRAHDEGSLRWLSTQPQGPCRGLQPRSRPIPNADRPCPGPGRLSRCGVHRGPGLAGVPPRPWNCPANRGAGNRAPAAYRGRHRRGLDRKGRSHVDRAVLPSLARRKGGFPTAAGVYRRHLKARHKACNASSAVYASDAVSTKLQLCPQWLTQNWTGLILLRSMPIASTHFIPRDPHAVVHA